MKVAKGVGLSIDEFHFVVETFGDAVIAGEAPHGHDLLGPGRERLAELNQWGQTCLSQLVNRAQETRRQLLTLPAVAMFLQQQIAEPLFEAVDGPAPDAEPDKRPGEAADPL